MATRRSRGAQRRGARPTVAALKVRLARTDRRVDRLESALIRLSEAGARADERLERLEAALERLAEAQLKY